MVTGLSRARACRWTAALALGEHRTAVDVSSLALAADPLDEPACRALMRAHQGRGADSAALAAFEQLRAALARELGTDPSPATQEVFLALLRHGTTTPAAAAGRPRTAATLRLTGREAELAELRAAWSQAAQGRGRLVVITGEAPWGPGARRWARWVRGR